MIFSTSFCNHGHDSKDGVPIGHECYVLPPDALFAEYMGAHDKACELIQKAKPLRVHRGRRPPKGATS